MRKYFKIFLLCLFTFLFYNTSVSAYELKCSDITQEINNYNKLTTDVEKIDCKKTTDSKIVNDCNKINLERSLSLSKLYKFQESDNNCPAQKAQIKLILDNNKDNCSLVSDGLLEKFADKLMLIFYIIGPILVIIFGSLDYTKSVVSSDPNALKQSTNRFIKRLVALILLFLVPTLVNIIINVNNSSKVLSGDAYVCNYNHIDLKKEYTIKTKEIEVKEAVRASGNSGSSSKSGMISGDYKGYKIRTKSPTMNDTKFYNPAESNTGQCVWYVKNRAKEILNTVKISAAYKNKALKSIESTYGNAKDWWNNSSLKSFGSSSNYKKPKVGAIIVWNSCAGHQYGHVGMVEKVNSDGTINYTEGWAAGGNSCPNSNMSCVRFQYKTSVNLKDIKVNYMGEPFRGYVYLLD